MTKVISFHRKRNSYSKKDFNTRSRDFNIKKFKYEKHKIFLAVISIFAILLGSVIYRCFPDKMINIYLENQLVFLQSGKYVQIFAFLIQFDILFIIISFFIGTSFLGSGFSFIAPTLKCLLIGYIGSYFYNIYELKGVMFCLLLLYPYFAVTTASLIFASNESIYMSNFLCGLLKSKNTADDISVRLYLLRYLILIVINTICTAINCGLIVIIGQKISLN